MLSKGGRPEAGRQGPRHQLLGRPVTGALLVPCTWEPATMIGHVEWPQRCRPDTQAAAAHLGPLVEGTEPDLKGCYSDIKTQRTDSRTTGSPEAALTGVSRWAFSLLVCDSQGRCSGKLTRSMRCGL